MDAYCWLDLPVGQVERMGVHIPEVTAPSIITEDSCVESWYLVAEPLSQVFCKAFLVILVPLHTCVNFTISLATVPSPQRMLSRSVVSDSATLWTI